MLLAGTRHSCCLSLSGKAIDARTLFVAHRFVGRTRTNRVRAAHHAIPWSHTPHALTSRINGTAGATWLRCRAVAGQVRPKRTGRTAASIAATPHLTPHQSQSEHMIVKGIFTAKTFRGYCYIKS